MVTARSVLSHHILLEDYLLSMERSACHNALESYAGRTVSPS
jgi:hypothetical protein